MTAEHDDEAAAAELADATAPPLDARALERARQEFVYVGADGLTHAQRAGLTVQTAQQQISTHTTTVEDE